MTRARSRPIEIIGGGLAGLALGIALRRADVAVTLHEAGRYPRHRVCGEFIAGLDPATNNSLGLAPLLHDALPHRDVAWFHASRAAPIARHTLPAAALGISRHTLDARLAEAFVAAGGALHTGSRFDPGAAAPGRVFTLGRRPVPASPWIGLKCHARDLRLSADLEVHLGARAYVGLCPVGEGGEKRINVCGLFHRRPGLVSDRDATLSAHLRAAGLVPLAERLAAAEIVPDSPCAVAGLAFGPAPPDATAHRDRLSLGDAHALIPPFTGDGMSMAFQSAALALAPLLAWANGETDWSATVATVRRRLRGHFRRRLATAAALHPVLLRPRAQALLAAAARARVLPLTPLYHALH